MASYEANERKRDQRAARTGFVIGVIGCVIGVLGVGSTAALAPLKQVYPLVFRVDQASGAVERVYDVQGGGMDVGEAEKRYFLWQYVRYRQTYTAAEAAMNFNSVALLSSSDVQQAYAALFKGTNPNSPLRMPLRRFSSSSTATSSRSRSSSSFTRQASFSPAQSGFAPLSVSRGYRI